MAAARHPLDPLLVPAKRVVFAGVCRRDPARYLRLRDRAAHAAAPLGLYERAGLRAAVQAVGPGDTAIDIGASFGVYTRLLARRAGPGGTVLALEPQPAVAARLRRRFAGIPQVTVLEAAAGATAGRRRLEVPELPGGVPEPALAGLTDGPGIDVEVVTLDERCADLAALAYLKVDAERSDLAVLHGARETLRRLRPVVQVECADPADLTALRTFADGLGYRVAPARGVNRLLLP